jgi:hypothetical protein
MTTGPTDSDLDADDTLADELDDAAEEDDQLADEDDSDHEAATSPTREQVSTRGRNRLQLSQTPSSLFVGQALTPAEANLVLGQFPAEVIVAVAEVEAGKTTLLAAIYESLCRGSMPGFAFDGSRSLLGFESRSFDATRASGNDDHKTGRTSRDAARTLLHLAVRDSTGCRRHLLMADVSGEHARNLVEFGEAGDYGVLLRAATRVLVLLDGAKLLTQVDQNATLSRARVLIRALAEGDDLCDEVPVELVVTKWDKCSAADGLEDELARLLRFSEARLKHVGLHVTAARPSGHGVAELFEALMKPQARPPVPDWPKSLGARPIHNFTAHAGIAAGFVGTQSAAETSNV